MNNNKLMDYLNDEHFRANMESGFTMLVAIAIVIISKGFITGFTADLFLSVEPYATGIGTGIASSIVMNNMINRGFYDELTENKELVKVLEDNANKDKQVIDYEYAEWFIDGYNKKEYERLQKVATDREVRKLQYAISALRSKGKKGKKLQKRIEHVKKYGSQVKKYKSVSLQDLLSFENDGELIGSDKLNYQPIKSQRKKLARSKITWFLASGIVAGIPLATGKNTLEAISFIIIFLLLIIVNGFRTYIKTRRITGTTYYKSMQYKGNVLQLCLDSKQKYYDMKNYEAPTPPKEDIIELIE